MVSCYDPVGPEDELRIAFGVVQMRFPFASEAKEQSVRCSASVKAGTELIAQLQEDVIPVRR